MKCVYEFGNFRLNTLERVLESAGQPLSVAPKALDVLIVLIENRGRIVEKEDLMRNVWPDTFVEDNSLAFNISVLRKLLGESGAAPHYIETVPRRGYRFIATVAEVESALPRVEAAREQEVKPTLLGTPQNTQETATTLGKLARKWAFVSALLILTAAAILTAHFRRTPKLTETDTIIVADFMNKTGDPVFDGTLHQGLEVQLEQSPSLSLIPEARIRKMLRLMGQPADARLTAELALDICKRTASSAVLEGSIASLGSQYVLGLRTQNCSTGEILHHDQVQAARKEDVLNALSQIARGVRLHMGESHGDD